ncbi:protein of unknown function, putative GTPase domain [Blastococcus saxobsidens DD2]|uniref:Uncharacterized protein n=1 Tax=Blastococcus saxobsidens (strain DD2) TaxID=1146883 RepID=H6RJM3_BLASD|nr:protein of unknown function, putative GTPase domain [Blastococcus saxobsidens DD2]
MFEERWSRGAGFARAAGAVYLLVVVVAAIVQVSVHAGIDVPGTANAGAQNSGAGSTLLAVARDADVSMAVSFLLVGVTLYLLFRHVDRRTAAAPVVYLAVGVGLLAVNLPSSTDSEAGPWSSSATTVTGKDRWVCAGRCWSGIGTTWISSRAGWSPAAPPSPTTEP